VAQTVEGEVQRVTFENEETHFRVVKVLIKGRGNVAVVGKFPFVGSGSHVRMVGEFVNDAKHGEQFRVQSLVVLEPQTVAGIERYLGSGIIPGIGPGLAKRIVDRFGSRTLAVLDEEPSRLSEVSGIGVARAEEVSTRWREQRVNSSLSITLQTHGVGMHLVRRIVEKYGDKATEVVQTEPYRLAMDVRGVGFKTADQLAAGLGLGKNHPDRLKAGVLHCLYQLSDDGHVFVDREHLEHSSTAMLAADAQLVSAAFDALWAAQRVIVEQGRVYLPHLHQAESRVAANVATRIDTVVQLDGIKEAIAAFEMRGQLQLADAQRQAVQAAATHGLVVITGGPGVGKTTIVRAILGVFNHAKKTVALAAPTGRAAKRLAESTGTLATTLHRLLAYEPRLNRFQRNALAPLDTDVLIIDETSMVDLLLCDAVLDALPQSSRLVLVGDADQLPSVGPGAFLRDLIESSKVPVIRLNVVFRQSSQSHIVRNAHEILQGHRPRSCARGEPHADFFIVERKDGDKAAETIVEMFTQRLPTGFNLDPVNDIQVLCPMHRGPTGTMQLNQRLQAAVNPNGAGIERRGSIFRTGDRVMQLRNDYDRHIYNGDVGYIRAIDPTAMSLSVQFEERTTEYSDADIDALTLAYATSVHKSQGSEYKAVIVPLLTAHFLMLSRNLLYTAVTRARKVCVLVADPKAIDIALSELRKEQRGTTLADRIREAVIHTGVK
jgi:exodeoxyribonuclease V alpha subunit